MTFIFEHDGNKENKSFTELDAPYARKIFEYTEVQEFCDTNEWPGLSVFKERLRVYCTTNGTQYDELTPDGFKRYSVGCFGHRTLIEPHISQQPISTPASSIDFSVLKCRQVTDRKEIALGVFILYKGWPSRVTKVNAVQIKVVRVHSFQENTVRIAAVSYIVEGETPDIDIATVAAALYSSGQRVYHPRNNLFYFLKTTNFRATMEGDQFVHEYTIEDLIPAVFCEVLFPNKQLGVDHVFMRVEHIADCNHDGRKSRMCDTGEHWCNAMICKECWFEEYIEDPEEDRRVPLRHCRRCWRQRQHQLHDRGADEEEVDHEAGGYYCEDCEKYSKCDTCLYHDTTLEWRRK